jgi:proteic killer suppression protein
LRELLGIDTIEDLRTACRQWVEDALEIEEKAREAKWSLNTPAEERRSAIEIQLDIAWVPCYREHMIRSFKNQGAEDIFDGKNSKAARKLCPRGLWSIAARKLEQVDSATNLDDLKIPPGNRLEALSGNRDGQYSIRINDQYRVCFEWSNGNADNVEIVDYH